MLRFTAKRLTIDRMFNFRNQVVSTKIFNVINPPMKLQILTLSAVALTLSLGAIVPMAAQAATVTHSTAPISFDDSDLSPGNTPLFLPYFDPAQGTLNRVIYSLTGNPYSEVTLTNTSKPPRSRSGSGSASADIVTYGAFNLNGSLTGAGYLQGIANVPSVFLTPGASITANDTYVSGASYYDTLSSDPFFPGSVASPSDFVKAGNFDDFEVILSSFSNISGYANFSFSVDGFAGVDNLVASVTYDYTPTEVPTPALLPGLIGLGFTVIRKRKALAAVA
jgi:hypothetical protein